MASNFLRLTLIGRDQSASSTVDALTRRIRIAGATISQIGDKVSGAGKSLSIGVTAPLAGIAALGIKTEADFSRQMAQVAVATNAPKASLKGLSDYALEMGAKTTFSAGEAAGAMLNLAKGGFTPAQIKGGALAATMNLAAAGGLDLSDAAVDVVSSMNTFNVKAKDAGTITDALAGAANASSADVSDLAMALSQGGAAARATKQSLADTAGMLGLLADNGIKGSDAGTSVKTFLLNLVPSSKAAATQMKDLGLKFSDANGRIDKLPAVAAKLQSAFKGMGDDQRIAAEKTMFGTDAFRAAEALYQSGPAKLKSYADAARAHGNAEKMAAAQMSGTAGAMESMRGSLETAALTIGQNLAPEVMRLSKVVTDLANWFSGLDDQTRSNIVTFALVAAAIGPVLFGTGKLISGVGSTVTMFANARTAATNFALGLRSASAASSAATGLAGTIGGAVRTVVTGFASGTAAAARWAASTAAAGASAAASAVATSARVVGSLVAQGAAYVASAARAAASTAAQVAVRGAQLAMAAATGIATAAQWLLNAAMTANPIGIVVVAIAALVAGLIWFFTQTKLGQGLVAGAFKGISVAFKWVQDAAATVFGWIGKNWPLLLAILTGPIGLAVLFVVNHWGQIQAATAAAFAAVRSAVSGAIAAVVGFVVGGVSNLVGRWIAGWNLVMSVVSSANAQIVAVVSGLVGDVIAFLTGLPGKAVAAFGKANQILLAVGKDMVNGLVNGISGAVGGVISTVSNMISSVIGTAKKGLDEHSPSKVFHRIGLWLTQGFRNGIAGGAEEVKSTMQSLVAKIVDLPKKAFAKSGVDKSALVKSLEVDTAALVKLARTRDRLAKSLAVAQDNLKGAIQDRNDYRANVTSSAIGGGDVASAFTTAKSDASDAASRASDLQSKIDDLDSSVSDSDADRGMLADKLAQAEAKRQAAIDAATAAQNAPADSGTSRDANKVDDAVGALTSAERTSKLKAAASQQQAADNAIAQLTKQLREFDQKVADYSADRADLVSQMNSANAKAKSSPVSILVENLKAQVGKVTQFRTLLTQLKAQGLDDTTYGQLVGAGVDQGLTTAQALAADGSGAVAQISALQTQLAAASDRLGATTSAQLYQAGVDSARALRDSLEGQVIAVTGAMGVVQQGIATSVAKLGIDTSGLMRQAGRDIADGLNVGLKDRQKALDKTLADIGGRMEKVLRKKTETHSPSRMSWGIADDWMAGLGGGLQAGIPRLNRIVSGLIPSDGYSSPKMAVAATGGGGWGPSASSSTAPTLHIENFHAGGLSADEVAAAWAWKSRWPS